MKMNAQLAVEIRPARESDTADMLEVTRTIFKGQDYVPMEWADWLADAEGALLVAEHQGRVVGLGKLTRLDAQDWWLQGLRVHPEFERRWVATQITEALVAAWQVQGSGAVRLATSSQRIPVHRLCERLGFVQVGEYSVFVAPAIDENYYNPRGLEQNFLPLSANEAEAATAFALKSPSVALASNLMDLCWEWAPPRAIYLQRARERDQAWWWRGGEGLLAVHIDQDEDEPEQPYLELAACEIEALRALLLDYRRLAARLGYAQATWNAPLHSDVLPILEAAGFRRGWEHALFVYSKS